MKVEITNQPPILGGGIRLVVRADDPADQVVLNQFNSQAQNEQTFIQVVAQPTSGMVPVGPISLTIGTKKRP